MAPSPARLPPTTVNTLVLLLKIGPLMAPAALTMAELVRPPLTIPVVFSVPPVTFAPPLIVPLFVNVPFVIKSGAVDVSAPVLMSVPAETTGIGEVVRAGYGRECWRPPE